MVSNIIENITEVYNMFQYPRGINFKTQSMEKNCIINLTMIVTLVIYKYI